MKRNNAEPDFTATLEQIRMRLTEAVASAESGENVDSGSNDAQHPMAWSAFNNAFNQFFFNYGR